VGSRARWALVVAAFLLVLVGLQQRLWFGDGGLAEVADLERRIRAQTAENARLAERNRALEAEVQDLKTGLEAVEERARRDLGMIRRDETFYLLVGE
jgi:cell division protein FtsB